MEGKTANRALRGALGLRSIITLGLGALAATSALASSAFYVSTDGSDSYTGLASTHTGGTTGPFLTLEKARDAVRALRVSNPSTGVVNVWVKNGNYYRTTTFTLSAPDKDTVYGGFGLGLTRLVGGRPVTGWARVTNQAVLKRLTGAAKTNVLQASLANNGITSPGTLKRRMANWDNGDNSALELFFKDAPMKLSQWPATGWATITGAPKGAKGKVFTYNSNEPKTWQKSADMWVHGFYATNWSDSHEQIASYDATKMTVNLVAPGPYYGVGSGFRFVFENILEEVNKPGEYYVDRTTKTLYFWPPSPINTGTAVASTLEAPIVTITGGSNITLSNLVVEGGRGSGVVINSGSGNLVQNCMIRNLGRMGAEIKAGTNNGVSSCEITQVGETGILVNGGNRTTLVAGGNYADGNHIYNFARWVRAYRPGVALNGVGNRASHNIITDAPHSAIQAGGNDQVVEYNEVARACQETGDSGAIYMLGQDLTQRGSIVRYNYLHDIFAPKWLPKGWAENPGIYLDDFGSGMQVYGNVISNLTTGMLIGGGRDNLVDGNAFYLTERPVVVDARGKTWAASFFAQNGPFFTKLAAVNGTSGVYALKYPALATILQHDYTAPENNTYSHNLVPATWMLNEYSDNSTIALQLAIKTNNLAGTDPLYVDPTQGNFSLSPSSPAFGIGFQAIPVTSIGTLSTPGTVVNNLP